MIEFYAICGVWRLNDSKWIFIVDYERGGSYSAISNDISFRSLVEVVAEDFGIVENLNSLKLSFSLPSKEDLPPMFIRNDRQLGVFLKKLVEFDGALQLCVTVDEGQSSSGSTDLTKRNDLSGNDGVSSLSSLFPHEKQAQPSSSIEMHCISGDNVFNQQAQTSSSRGMHGISDYNVGNQAPNIHDPLLDRNNIDFSCPAPLHSMNAVSENALPTKDHEVISAPTRFSKFDIGVKDELRVGSVFKSKEQLTKCLEVLAVNESFEFRTPRSDRGRIRYCCVDAKCCWVLRATSYNRDAGSFVVTVFVNEHNCDTSLRNFNRSQAKSKTVGELVSHYFEGGKVALKPKQIMEMFRHEGGVGMSYSKAWRAKEYAIDCARGTATNGYEDLPSWLYMVEKTNPGSVTSLKIDKDGSFKYAFLAFGASLRGFKLLRKVISIDGSHLKAKFKGTLLGVSAQDGNFNLYPLAFGIVDSETTAAWDWFLKCLKKIIPDEPDLVIVSDRAQSIASAVMSNYPLAHHGLCYFHLEKNLEIGFKCSSLIAVVKDAAYAYSRHEFDLLFAEINLAHPKLADYLWKLDISRWSRAYAPSNRFNIMTSNLAECLNSLLNEPREYPIVYLFETIRCVLSRWFYERHEEGKNHRHKVTKNVGKRMTASYNSAARKFNVAPVSRSVFEVKGDKFKHIVDLDKRECTCGFFSIEKFPCSHAIAAAKKISLRENDFVDDHYLNERWILAYSETIFPVGDKAFWDIPAEVNSILCLPPFTRVPSGRPKNGRILSAWEKWKSNKCSRCQQNGHKKSTCVNPI